MAGENAVLSIAGYGQRRVRVLRLSYGIEIHNPASGGEDQSRSAKQFHVSKVTRGSFALNVVFTTHEEYQGFMRWLEQYVRNVANPAGVPTPIRVTIPVRGFDRLGVLDSGITFGEQAGQVTWKSTLAFTASRNLLDYSNADLRSTFVAPESDDPALLYLYPAGEQLSGVKAGKDLVDFDEFDEDPNIDNLGPPFRQPDPDLPWFDIENPIGLP